VAIGCCIGCSYMLKQVDMQPERMVAGILEQPIGLIDTNTEVFQDGIWKPWGEELVARRDDLTTEDLMAFGSAMWHQDFIFSIPKERIPSIQTPMLVMAGADAAHPREVAVEMHDLLPNSEYVDEWKTPELVPETTKRIREFLQRHVEVAV
jgi:pimeloyl-ACP methyl ester carboxylesterase